MRALFLILLLFNSPVWAGDKTEAWAKRVIELRSQVELLNEEYKLKKNEMKNQIQSLALQKTEVESQIRSEKMKSHQLQEKIKKIQKSLNEGSVEGESLKPALVETIAKMRQYIQNSIPFKKDERLGALRLLEDQLSKKEISAVTASKQLWSLMEDERRLGREVSLHKQTIRLSGSMKLAEVAKVGMNFLYFRTDDQVYGTVKKINGEWVYISFQSEDKKKQVLAFMDSLKKQIRQGYFEIPVGI